MNEAIAATDIAFVPCAASARPPAGDGPAPRGELAPSHAPDRKHVRTIVMHARCVVPSAMALVDVPLSSVGGGHYPVTMEPRDVATRLAAMDAQQVDMQVLSINPFWYGADVDLARQVVDTQNETLAA